MTPLASAPTRRRLAIAAAVLTVAAASLGAGRRATSQEDASRRASGDSAAVVAAVTRFQSALAAGDSATALELLAADALVLESGDVETRAEYRAHHLPADIAFAQGVPATRTLRGVVVHGNAAWVSSTSAAKGTFRGREMNTSGAELIVLSRSGADAPWRVRAIHWSSRRRS